MTQLREEIARLSGEAAPHGPGWEKIEAAIAQEARARLGELDLQDPERRKRVAMSALIIMMELWLLGVPLPPAAIALLHGVRRLAEEKGLDPRLLELWTAQGTASLRHFIPASTLELVREAVEKNFPETAEVFGGSGGAEGWG